MENLLDHDEDETDLSRLSQKEAYQAVADIIRRLNGDNDDDDDEDISDSESDCSQDAENLIVLCKTHEKLAKKQFIDFQGRRVSPMEYLISSRASLDAIQSFTNHFPTLIETPGFLGKYPLHWACVMKQPVPGLIPFLAQQFPSAASKIEWDTRKRPIELILRQRSSLMDVQALLAADSPEGDESKQMRLLNAAVWGACAEPVMNCIISHCPLAQELHLKSPVTMGRFSEECSKALSLLLPQLTKLTVTLSWRTITMTLGAFQDLMHFIGEAASLRFLALYLLPTATDPFLSEVYRAIASMQNLETLILDVNPSRIDTKHEANGITDALVSLLQRNTLKVLTVKGLLVLHQPLLEVLNHPSELEELNISSFVDSEEKREALAEVLLHNTSLCNVTLSSRGGSSRTYEFIQYITLLNRLGRKQARSVQTSKRHFVNLLAMADSRLSGPERDTEKFQCRYGLLRECPFIWC